MDRNKIVQVVLDAITLANHARDQEDQIPLDTNTGLYGVNGHLDSMSLVSLLIEVEEALMDNHGLQISLSDERAMSQANSPFLSIQSIVDYIESLIPKS
ncbi:MAG: hypothetical protein K9L32_11795 [Chromatiaceae bacterium]|nr:hypothetical protein [Chromatiaceae bacterium]